MKRSGFDPGHTALTILVMMICLTVAASSAKTIRIDSRTAVAEQQSGFMVPGAAYDQVMNGLFAAAGN